MTSIILATQSKYKMALFQKFGLPFKAQTPPYSEPELPCLPIEIAQIHARGKAASIDGPVVIGMDQVLELEGKTLHKPGSTQKAIEQVMSLRGKKHRLHTAYAIRTDNHWHEGLTTSTLEIHHDLSRDFIQKIVEQDQTQDCVGGYKIESMGLLFMASVETSDWDAIIGQPTLKLAQTLEKLGFFPGKFAKDSQNK